MQIEISDQTYRTISDQLAMLIQERKEARAMARRDGMKGFERLCDSTLRELESARDELRKECRSKR